MNVGGTALPAPFVASYSSSRLYRDPGKLLWRHHAKVQAIAVLYGSANCDNHSAGRSWRDLP
jgi:hypothetical protein